METGSLAGSTWSRPLVRLGKDLTFDAGLILVLLVAGMTQNFWQRRWQSFPRIAGWIGIALFAAFCSPLFSQFIRNPLLDAAARLSSSSTGCAGHPGPVVVLGGGASPDGIPGAETLDRLVAAKRWLTQNTAGRSAKTTVVVTGGPANLNIAGSRTESDAMAEMLVRLLHDAPAGEAGVEIIKESASLNTHDNAIFTRKLLKDVVPNIVLVTSQVHMPRAAAVFSRTGFNVCAVIAPEPRPAPGLLTESGWINFGTARRTMTTLNEYVGLVAYRLKGWL